MKPVISHNINKVINTADKVILVKQIERLQTKIGHKCIAAHLSAPTPWRNFWRCNVWTSKDLEEPTITIFGIDSITTLRATLDTLQAGGWHE